MCAGRAATCSHPEVAENNTCTCAPGFTWTDNVCTSCGLGTYKEEAGQHACTSCPDNHTTFPNATEAADCMCTHGHEPGLGAQPCSPCHPGFCKAFKGNNTCQSCTANATTPLVGSVVICRAFLKFFPCNHIIKIKNKNFFFRRSKRQRNFSLLFFTS